MNLSNLSVLAKIASLWREQKNKHADVVILRILRTWGPVTAGEVSGLTGYKIGATEARLDDLLERGLIRCSNGRWYPASPNRRS